MMTPSKQPPTEHNKHYFLKINIKNYYHAKLQVCINFSFRKKQGGGVNLPSPQNARLKRLKRYHKEYIFKIIKQLR